MYNRVGQTLKEYSQRYVVTRTATSFLLVFLDGLAVSFILSQSGSSYPGLMVLWIALLIAIPVSTYHRAKMEAIRQYAFGEMVDDIEQIRDMLSYVVEQPSEE